MPTLYPDGPNDFLEKMATMPDAHPGDHEFEGHEAMDCVCKHCGFIQPDVSTDCTCGEDLRFHAIERIAPQLALSMLGSGMMMEVIVIGGDEDD